MKHLALLVLAFTSTVAPTNAHAAKRARPKRRKTPRPLTPKGHATRRIRPCNACCKGVYPQSTLSDTGAENNLT